MEYVNGLDALHLGGWAMACPSGAPMTRYVLPILLACVGISAGFYIVPLQALLQHMSPEAERALSAELIDDRGKGSNAARSVGVMLILDSIPTNTSETDS